MNYAFTLWRAVGAAAVGGALLSACVTAPKPLYDWQGYQPQVYEYFKGESKEAQATALEADLQKIKAHNGAVPPGYHAQLGLLYASLGRDDRMVEEFQAEKQLFPESGAYIDFLLKSKKPGAQ